MSTSFATQSEDDNVLVTGVAGDVNAISYFGYAYYVENSGQAQGRRDRRWQRLRRPDRRDDRRQQLLAAEPPAVHLPEHRQGRRRSPALYEFVDFYLANAAHPGGRGRLHRRPGRRWRRSSWPTGTPPSRSRPTPPAEATPRPTRTVRGVAFVHHTCARLHTSNVEGHHPMAAGQIQLTRRRPWSRTDHRGAPVRRGCPRGRHDDRDRRHPRVPDARSSSSRSTRSTS